MNLAQVALDPGPVPQRSLVGDRLDGQRAGGGAVGLGADLDLDAFADGSLEVPIDLAIGLDVLAFDRQQEIAGLHVHSRGGQRRVRDGSQ